MKPRTQVTILQPTADRPSYWVADHRMTLLISGEQTNHAYSLLELYIVPGGGPPPHIHHREDETFYVLDGDITIVAGEQTVRAGAGTCVHIPSGTVHTFKNEDEGPGRMLIMYAPAGFEHYFSLAGTPATSDDETAPPFTQAIIDRLQAHAGAFHMEILPPP